MRRRVDSAQLIMNLKKKKKKKVAAVYFPVNANEKMLNGRHMLHSNELPAKAL